MGKSVRDRITPACAGKTEEMKRYLTEAEDHPRVCGENALSSARFAFV